MTIIGLSGNIWPVHPKPLPDELLSSWIVRLAHGHGLKLQTFCSLVFGREKSIWTRDIDKLAPDWLITKLSKATGVSVLEVGETTLRTYEGILYEHHQPNGNTKWITPLGIYHRIHRSPGLHCCQKCLAADAEPYFRRRWRLAFSTVCTKHGCYLLDSCPECESPLAPHRSDMQGMQHFPRAGLNARCWKCDFDLRDSRHTEVPDKSLVMFQAQLEQILGDEYANWAGNPTMHSIVFFDGLRALIAGITSRHSRERLKKSIKLEDIDLSDWPRTGLEMASLSMRRELFRLLAKVLERWPTNFIELIHECKLRYADLKGDSEQRSLWYEDVIRYEAGGGYALISQDEANAIADAVETKYGRLNLKAATRLSGRDIASHVADHLPRPISDDVYEELLTSIDHQIAGTLDEIERSCLIRDKIMFVAGRQIGLSEVALANLTLERLRSLVSEEERLAFSEVARTSRQSRAWIEWYWKKVRPKLRPRADVDVVFTSSLTRQGLRHSAVSARFCKAVEFAMLKGSIRSYGQWVAGRSLS